MKEESFLNSVFQHALQVDLTVIWDHVDHHWWTRRLLVIYKIINNNHNIINKNTHNTYIYSCVGWTYAFLIRISENISTWLLFSLLILYQLVKWKGKYLWKIFISSFLLLCCFSSFPIKNHQKMSANERLSSFLSFLKIQSPLLYSLLIIKIKPYLRLTHSTITTHSWAYLVHYSIHTEIFVPVAPSSSTLNKSIYEYSQFFVLYFPKNLSVNVAWWSWYWS